MKYLIDAFPYMAKEKHTAFLAKGYIVTPILTITYYADSFNNLFDSKDAFQKELAQYLGPYVSPVDDTSGANCPPASMRRSITPIWIRSPLVRANWRWSPFCTMVTYGTLPYKRRDGYAASLFWNDLSRQARFDHWRQPRLRLLMARRFLECGAKVAICCAPHEDIDEAVAQLRALDASYDVLGFHPELTDEAALDDILTQIETQWGGWIF